MSVKENCLTEGATPEAASSGALTRTDLALNDVKRLGQAEPLERNDAGVAVASVATLAIDCACWARDLKSVI